MQDREILRKYVPLALLAFVLVLCVKYWSEVVGFGDTLLGAMTALILGGVIAFIVNIPMKGYEKLYKKLLGEGAKGCRLVSVILAFFTIVVIFLLIAGIILPRLIDSIYSAAMAGYTQLQELLTNMQSNEYFGQYAVTVQELLPKKMDVSSIIDKAGSFVATGASGLFTSVVSSVSALVSGATNLILGIMFSFYILGNKETLARQFSGLIRTYLPEKWSGRILLFVTELGKSFGGFIVAQATDATILGTLCGIGMLILQIPYAGTCAVIVGSMALIPVVGAVLGALLSAVLILTVSPIKALIFLVFLIILQQVDSNLIYPRVIGNSVNLPSMWVLASVTVGGGIAGILGMLCGVPVVATVYKLLGDDYHRRNGLPVAADGEAGEAALTGESGETGLQEAADGRSAESEPAESEEPGDR